MKILDDIRNIRDSIPFSNSRQAIVLSILLLFLCVSGVIIFSVRSCSRKPAAKQTADDHSLVTDQPLLLPDGPALPQGYTVYRNARSKWTEEDVDGWFKTPDKHLTDSLSTANDTCISDILGAAP